MTLGQPSSLHDRADPTGLHKQKNLEILALERHAAPPLERGLIDELDLHVLPRLLGDDPNATTNLRFRTTYEK